jgi:gas vesicle structural protein
MAIQPSPGGAVQRQQETSSLADVVGTILDKGVVIDVFARVSLVGIEVLRVDARVVVASVDTYLRFAEAANRLELGTGEPTGLPGLVEDISDSGKSGAREGGTRGALEAGADKLGDLLRPGDDDEKEEDEQEEVARPRRRRR